MLNPLLFLSIFSLSQASASAVVVEVISGEHEDDCGIYPPCKQFGEGCHEILEDCRRYINCTLATDTGHYTQYNMVCPGDLVYANEYSDCVEYDRATDCKVFQGTPCLNQCPRVMLESTGLALNNKENLLGCFRLQGSKVGNTLVEYQNMNRFYLTPDAFSTVFISHWLISEQQNPINGGIKNEKYDYIHCPYDNWDGWEVDSGHGTWEEDNTMKTTCHIGSESATTNLPPISTTPDGNPTNPPVRCHRDGANGIGHCLEEFICCKAENGGWTETECHCLNDFVYDEVNTQCQNNTSPR